MKIIIEGCDDLDICSMEDLPKLIPSTLNGKPLNYGQGEGQIEIEGTVWDLYYSENDTYILQFEEGVIEWLMLQKIVSALMENISDKFCRDVKFHIKGIEGFLN
ncbi:MAG: hypothetical protein KME27_16235 [Lyngbya sp. HA4199-MV5]|jgi:hypothetical protein|nr:hypothetical protein [Lyngbya sp. HA4199-MV5]